jgi:hypothetical protein
MTELQAVTQTFNRLLRLEILNDQDVMRVPTLFGTLNAAGWVVDFDQCGNLDDWHPCGMTAAELLDSLESLGVPFVERDDAPPMPPSRFVRAMTTEVTE